MGGGVVLYKGFHLTIGEKKKVHLQVSTLVIKKKKGCAKIWRVQKLPRFKGHHW